MADNQTYESQKDLQVRTAQTKLLERGLLYADQYINRQYMVGLPMYNVAEIDVNQFSAMRLFHINKLVYDADEELTDKLISVYGALNSIQSTLILILRSSQEGVDLYLGTRCDAQASTAGGILQAGISGNFNGSEFESLPGSEIRNLLVPYLPENSRQCVSTVTLVPSLRDKERAHSVQGIEKLMDGMTGKEFLAILIAEPMDQKAIEVQKRGLEELYSTISPYAETSLSYGNNASYAVADGTTSTFSDSINNSITNSNSESTSHSSTSGSNSGSSASFSGDGASFSTSSGSSYSETYSSSSSWSHAVTSGQTKTTSTGTSQTITNTVGESRTLTIKHVNKSVNELMKNIDSQLERIRACESFGLWATAAYFISPDVQMSVMAASTFRALVAGDDTYLDKSIINLWDQNNAKTDMVLKAILHGSHPRINVPRMNEFNEQKVKPTILVSGKELPIFMSLPRKSLPGVLVDYMASFGRAVYNPYENQDHEKFVLGSVQHKGIVNGNLKVMLDIEELRAHCFVTGSTGSGKSNTTYHIIQQLLDRGKKFLVIEPAKGEYKYAFGKLEGINIFWTNPQKYRLLRLNPFSFPDGVHVLEHMDRLIEILNLCWPLYSAMPAILKAATEKAYAEAGWDLANSLYVGEGAKTFPTFADLLRELPAVINESSYSADAKGDYTGALVTRVTSLTNGIMGKIFCSNGEVDNAVLFDENTIVDLSRVGSSETKALIMGILIMKLNEYRMSSGAGMNAQLRHLTVMEEAHNLLKRPGPGSSELAAKSVEMISNSIAEMRSYGEGFLIVDQSPTSVDISAIKNTNTKIVMRLPEKADFEAVGGSFGLKEDQIREISRLPRGTAIVSQSGWLEPVMTHISRASDRYETAPIRDCEEMAGDSVKKFIETVLEQVDNLSFNDYPIKRILKASGISENRKDYLLSLYYGLCRSMGDRDELTTNERAAFVIQAVGCAGLADVFRLKLDPNLGKQNWKLFDDWKMKIAKALVAYGDFGPLEYRLGIAHDLFIYTVFSAENMTYKKNRVILEKFR